MAGVHHDSLIRRSGSWACILACWINAIASAQGPSFPQGGPQPGEYAPPNIGPPPGAPGNPGTYRPGVPENIGPAPAPGASAVPIPAPRPGETLVVEVVFEGMKPIRRGQLAKLGTRAGEPYDPQIVEEDVKKLMKSRKFIDVAPKIQSVPQGVIVIFQVVERPIIQYIKMVGNQGVLTSTLIGKTDLKVGDGMDPYSIKEARDKLEAYYQEHGWDRARVSIIEGNKPGDKGAIFLIDEGRAQKVWWTKFFGNTIVTAARLRTQIDTKPPILWIFKGDVNRKKIDEDVQKLTAYYRGLGFFQATVGRELNFDEKQNWLTLTFIINEGPRYKIRNVSFIGDEKLGPATLGKDLKLTAGQWFNQGAMDHDLNVVRDLYGGKGYVFADVKPDPRLLEGQAEMDLIYNIKEGSRYRVGMINVNIQGDSTHTHSRTIYDRLSLRPGDILDTRKLRGDERRIKASQLFATDPTKAPKIVFSPLGGDPDKAIAERPTSGRKRFGVAPSSADSAGPDNYRGQSPDGPSDQDVLVSLDVDGTLLPGADRRVDVNAMPGPATPDTTLPPLFTEMRMPADVWQRIADQVRPPAQRVSQAPIVRGQSPNSVYSLQDGRDTGQPMPYRDQPTNGGWPPQPSAPDPKSGVMRYQPLPSNAPPTGYAPRASAVNVLTRGDSE